MLGFNCGVWFSPEVVSIPIPSGLQSVRWNGNNSQGNKVKSGIFFYRLRIGKYEVIKKIILMDE